MGALNAIANAWSKFNRVEKDPGKEKTNRLRTVVLQNVENQTVIGSRKTKIALKSTTGFDPEKEKGYYEAPQEGEPIDLGF